MTRPGNDTAHANAVDANAIHASTHEDGHASDEQLTQVALGELAAGGEVVGEHLATCQRCRDTVQFVRAVRRTLDAPRHHADNAPLGDDASDRLLERILTATGGGPVAHVERRLVSPRAWRWIAGGVLAAAAASFVLLTGRAGVGANAPTSAGANDTSPFAMSDLSSLSLWPALAYAQTPPGKAEPPYDHVQLAGIARLVPGTRTYVRSSASAYHDVMPIGGIAVQADTIMLGAQPAVRLVTRDPLSRSGTQLDSVWLRRSDLAVLYRRLHRYGSITTQRRLNDTVLQQYDTIRVPPTVRAKFDPRIRSVTRSIVVRPNRLLVTDQASFITLLRVLPLDATWRGSIDVNADASSGAIFRTPRSLNLSVQGDSVVSTLWGHVPCWRVMLHTGPNPERWYVTKESGEVLLMTGPNGRHWPRSRLDLIGRYLK